MQSRLFYNIARYLLAALFLFSGFAKSINPFGLSIQFGDYFSALGVPFLAPLSVFGAIVLPAAEFMLGAMLAAGIFRKFCAWATAIFMGFFTLLTLWIAIYNPVNDCGCFGDLLIISNWQTFFKNIVFDIFVVVLFVGRKGGDIVKWRWIAAGVMAAAALILPIYSYLNLPLIDATVYKVGVNIARAVESGRNLDGGHTTLIYKDLQSGKTREFEISDTTWQDESRWEFVDSRTTAVDNAHKGRMSPLVAINGDGVNVADSILASPHATLFIIPDTKNISPSISEVIRATDGDKFLLHSSIEAPDIDGIEVLTSDGTMLKTMIQHHSGGVMILERGTIIAKHGLSDCLALEL